MIASIPGRLSNLHSLLDDLSGQSMRPDAVSFVFDGYKEPPVVLERPWAVHKYEAKRHYGASERWRILSDKQFVDDDECVVVVLDDDFRVGPYYIEDTISRLLKTKAAMVAWSGHVTPKKYISFDVSAGKDAFLWSAGTGACAFHAPHMRGILSSELGHLLGEWSDDELVVSRHFYNQGLAMLRPAGSPKLHAVDALQNARDASHVLNGNQWEAARRQISKDLRWTHGHDV